MTFDRIYSIRRRKVDGKFRFIVELGAGTPGITERVEVSAGALRTYPTFQTAVLETAGIFYREDSYEVPRVGARHWAEDLESHLDAAENEPAERIVEGAR